ANAAEARAVDHQLDASDTKLNKAVGSALRAAGPTPAERRVVDRIRAAFPRYLTVRERIVSSGRPGTVDTEANRNRMRQAFDELQAAQEAYGAGHFAAAGNDLRALRAQRGWRSLALALALLFGLVSLVGVLLLVRRVAVRVREYAAFAGRVAEG